MKSAPKVVLFGMMSRTPVPGVVFQTVHYLRGLHELGFDVYYVEDHGMTPRPFFTAGVADGWSAAAGFVERVLADHGLAGKWAYHAEFGGDRHFGMSAPALANLYREAALLINLHGSTRPRPEHAATGRLVYLETDPVEVQVQLAQGNASTAEYLEAHVAHFTFGESYGTPQCGLPVSDRFEFWPTRQPVVLDLWQRERPPAGHVFTTIGNWRQTHRDVQLAGESYGWSKHREFDRFLRLPALTGASFRLALSSYGEEDRRLLEEHGWSLHAPFLGYEDIEAYRDFILGSAGEFTVAKDQNVRLRTGWFSDRSATYLAAGRPVITQDTGFGAQLPTGKGLFAFRDLDEAAAAVDEVRSNPALHQRAAREIAAEHFSAPVVLRDFLDRLGLAPAPAGRGRAAFGLPGELRVQPVSRWPTTLAESTTSLMDARVRTRIREAEGRRAMAADSANPEVSIVIVTHGGAAFTAMCMESVLADRDAPALEVVVVDNASPDGTGALVDAYARLDSRVRVFAQADNLGFARANNIGIAAARGDTVVLLNSDTVVPNGWLRTLLPYLDDPAVGFVGPVTNRTCNEAEVDAPYRTVAELESHAERTGTERGGESFELSMLAMFCLAGRRATFARLGPLDEEYGVGMFEDEDYAASARAAGLRLVCAEDSFVHHFGQASLGRVLDPVAYDELFARNRARFEQRWGVSWQPHRRRPAAGYDELCGRVRRRIEQVTPAGAYVLVAAKGDDAFLALDGRTAGHFPGTPEGRFLGEYPKDSASAVEVLDAQQAGGAEYVVFPATSAWWLDHYRGLAAHLEAGGPPVHRDDDCVVWALPSRATEDAAAALRRTVAGQADELARMGEELAALRELLAGGVAAPALAPAETTVVVGEAAADLGDVWHAIERHMAETEASASTRYLAQRGRLRAALAELVPAGATVAVVTHGDDSLVALPGRTAWHLPRLADGEWAGCHPKDGRDAIVHVELAAALGADYLALPAASGWWLDHYPELAAHLDRNAMLVLSDPGVGQVWSLARAATEDGALARVVEQARRHLAGADPSILDWDSGLDLARRLPELAVFSPPIAGPTLPYLDASVDLVTVAAGDRPREIEASRVAAVAVLVAEAGGVHARWLRREPEVRRLSTTVVQLGGMGTRSLRRSLPAGSGADVLSEADAPEQIDADLLAVVGPGVVPLRGWLDELFAPLRDGRVDAVTAPAATSPSGAVFDGVTAGPAVLVTRNRERDGWRPPADAGVEPLEAIVARLRAGGATVVDLETPVAVRWGAAS
jgi:GT2 family glycosyltransferase